MDYRDIYFTWWLQQAIQRQLLDAMMFRHAPFTKDQNPCQQSTPGPVQPPIADKPILLPKVPPPD